MNKYALLGVFALIFFAGLGAIVSHESVSFSQLLSSLSNINSKVLSLLALPIIAVLFVLGVYLRRKKEEQMWKKALLKTRAKKQH